MQPFLVKIAIDSAPILCYNAYEKKMMEAKDMRLASYKAGLVSISFRKHTPEEILGAMREAGLSYIEWGSDVHAPVGDLEKVRSIAALQAAAGVECCSYGTYFRLGENEPEEIRDYIAAAKLLGTNILRLWAGRKSHLNATAEERERLLADMRRVVEIAEEEGAVICLECHRNTYTEHLDGTLELLREIPSEHFKMYWQPNPDVSFAENLAYLRAISSRLSHLHVFHWSKEAHLPLADGVGEWNRYLEGLSGEHGALLEFMPDNLLTSLSREARALLEIVGE